MRPTTCSRASHTAAQLDLWLTRHARQAAGARSARTYVIVDAAQARVVGYHALAAASVATKTATARVAKGMPRHPVPVVLLARLAVAQARAFYVRHGLEPSPSDPLHLMILTKDIAAALAAAK